MNRADRLNPGNSMLPNEDFTSKMNSAGIRGGWKR
jgi:hypothetical protein